MTSCIQEIEICSNGIKTKSQLDLYPLLKGANTAHLISKTNISKGLGHFVNKTGQTDLTSFNKLS